MEFEPVMPLSTFSGFALADALLSIILSDKVLSLEGRSLSNS